MGKSKFCVRLLSIAALSLSLNLRAHDDCHYSTPENFLSYPSSVKSNGLMDQGIFNLLLQMFEEFGAKEVQDNMAKKLFIQADWDDAAVQAYATRDDDNNPVIVLKGGMARHPEMSPSGLLLILCHELGHFLGGAPKKPRGNSGKFSWSSAEGQADYYATSKCARRFFKTDSVSKLLASLPNPLSQASIKKVCGDNLTCGHVAGASLSVAKVFASMRWGGAQVAIGSPDQTVVHETQYKHPRSQCRLDTFLAGFQCPIGSDIPFDDRDPNQGSCVEAEKKPNSSFARPRCWYK